MNAVKLIGLDLTDAEKQLRDSGYKVQVHYVDGPPSAMTENHDVGRVSLSVKNGKVIGARVG